MPTSSAGRAASARRRCARIFARALNGGESPEEKMPSRRRSWRGEDLDVIEIDAASNTGVDNVRDLIANAAARRAAGASSRSTSSTKSTCSRKGAFNALLKTMEEPPEHVKFILCTTDPHKVPPTIQSRCQRFDFRPIPSTLIGEHLRAVVKQEGLEAEPELIHAVAKAGNGSMRDALSLLERLLAAAETDESSDGGPKATLTWTLLEDIFGLPDETLLERVVEAIGQGDARAALERGAELLDRGLSIERALDLLAERFRWLMLAIVCGKDTELLEVASDTRDALARLAPMFDAASLVHRIALCDAVASKARDSSNPRTLFDAGLVRQCYVEQFASAAAALSGAPPAGAMSGGPPAKKPSSGSATLSRGPR
jgi:DNA polymerase-3 subunit gamma/tau